MRILSYSIDEGNINSRHNISDMLKRPITVLEKSKTSSLSSLFALDPVAV